MPRPLVNDTHKDVDLGLILLLLVLLQPDSNLDLGDLLHVEMLGVMLRPLLGTGEAFLQVLVLMSPLLSAPELLTSLWWRGKPCWAIPVGEHNVMESLGEGRGWCEGRYEEKVKHSTSGEAWKEIEGDSTAGREIQAVVTLQGDQVK